MTEKTFGELISSATGRTPFRNAAGATPAARIASANRKAAMTAARKPRPSAVSDSWTSGQSRLLQPSAARDDREVLRADHHGPDDQDLRVGQDAHGRDQPGDDQQDVEARRVGGVSADCALHHGPDRDLLPAGVPPGLGRVARAGQGHVHLADRDRAPAVPCSPRSCRSTGLADSLSRSNCTASPSGRRAAPGSTTRLRTPGSADSAAHQPRRQILRAHHAHVEHPASPVSPASRTTAGPPGRSCAGPAGIASGGYTPRSATRRPEAMAALKALKSRSFWSAYAAAKSAIAFSNTSEPPR